MLFIIFNFKAYAKRIEIYWSNMVIFKANSHKDNAFESTLKRKYK